MIRRKLVIIILGFVIFLLPLLGFPGAVRNTLVSVAGLAVAVITYLFDPGKSGFRKEKIKPDSYTENNKEEVDNNRLVV